VVGRLVHAAAVVGVPVAVPVVGRPAVAAAVVVVARAAIPVSPPVVRGRVDTVRTHVVTEAHPYEQRAGAVAGAEAETDAREETAGPDTERNMRLRLDRGRRESRHRQGCHRCSRHGTHGVLLTSLGCRLFEVHGSCQEGVWIVTSTATWVYGHIKGSGPPPGCVRTAGHPATPAGHGTDCPRGARNRPSRLPP
jgi:hypothetical protein